MPPLALARRTNDLDPPAHRRCRCLRVQSGRAGPQHRDPVRDDHLHVPLVAPESVLRDGVAVGDSLEPFAAQQQLVSMLSRRW